MELLQLKYFLEVAHTQHITRSAQRLHISQPSLSQAIKRLESELGVPLFATKGRNIELTDYGRFLQTKLEPLMERLDVIPEQIRSLADPESSTLRLCVPAASLIVSEAIIAYKHIHEKAHFQFLHYDDDDLCDITVNSSLEPPRQKGAGEDVFTCEESIFIAVPGDVPETGKRELVEFADSDFISLAAPRQFRLICDKLCQQAGFTPNICFESDSPSTVRNMIAASMGVGFWPAFTWGSLNRTNAHLVRISRPPCRRCIVIRRKHNRMDNRLVDDFYAFLCEFFSEKQRESLEV